MKLYLPEIYPDELVYSWLARYTVYSGCISNPVITSQLLYSERNHPNVEFIGFLNDNAIEQIQSLYTFKYLFLHHTMLPQCIQFMPNEKKMEILKKLHANYDLRGMIPTRSRVENEKYLKYCPLCVEEDRETYGETYWHRMHQIGNAFVCPIHKCQLQNSTCSAISRKKFSFVPAETVIITTPPIFPDNEEQLNFSIYTAHLFYADVEKSNSSSVNTIIYNRMINKNYITGSKRDKIIFESDLYKYFKKIGINNIVSRQQIEKVLLSKSYNFYVICQVAYFLGISIDELIELTT